MTQEETINWLDSLEHYKFIADEDELKWFFDHCVYPLKANEAYAFCLSMRRKKLSEEDKKLPVGQVEMLDPTVVFSSKDGTTSFEKFKAGIRAYECHKETYMFGGRTLPAKATVIYFHINPCDELRVISDLKKYINIHEQELIDSSIKDIDRANYIHNILGPDLDMFFKDPSGENLDTIHKRIGALKTKTAECGVAQSLYKMCKSLSKMRRLQFDNVGTKYWVDFDIDVERKEDKSLIYTVTHDAFINKIGKGNFVIVETGGGFHVLVKKECINFNPYGFINDIKQTSISMTGIFEDLIKEMDYNVNAMIPCPGTYMYGYHIVKIVNKEDFN